MAFGDIPNHMDKQMDNNSDDDNQSIEDIFMDAIGDIQKASIRLNQSMKKDDLEEDMFEDAVGENSSDEK